MNTELSVNNIKTIKFFFFILLLLFSRDSRDLKSSLRGGGHVRERMSDYVWIDACLRRGDPRFERLHVSPLFISNNISPPKLIQALSVQPAHKRKDTGDY